MESSAATSPPDDGHCAEPISPDSATDDKWIDFVSDLVLTCTYSVAKSNALPVQSDYTFYDAFPIFRSEIASLKSTLLTSISQLIKVVDKENEFTRADNDADRFRCLSEATDMVLERVDMIIDQKPSTSNIVVKSTTETKAAKQSHRSLHNRPQNLFKEPIDNSRTPWRPIIRGFLPNHHTSMNADAVAPSPKLGPDMMSHISSLGISTSKTPHLYKTELERLTFSEELLRPRAEKMYRSLEETPYKWIDTEEGLRGLADILSNEKEFAVDLEHHNFRSYLGFTCLMQVSTRSHDYIVDTLQIRHCMHLLLDAFTNPSIVKVFHGADYDICWLQKDFSLFVVNMFDTGQAARALQLESFSLKFLLDQYCDVQTSKAFQRADWRLRPIPAPMIKYARSDTHYLLYIYDRMCNQLCEQSTSALLSVYEKSRHICLKTFEKPVCTSESYIKLINQFDLVLDQKQEMVLQNLYCWRDKIARELDESCGYVLPNAVLISISKAMPSDQNALLNIAPNLSPPVRNNVSELLDGISKVIADLSIDVPTTSYTAPSYQNEAIVSASEPKEIVVENEHSNLFQLPNSVCAELARRSSSRMFDSDSDDSNCDGDIEAAEAVKQQILSSLRSSSASASDSATNVPSETRLCEASICQDNDASSSAVVLCEELEPETHDIHSENEEMQSVVSNKKASSDNVSLNEMKFGSNCKRKSQKPAQLHKAKSTSTLQSFDYQKAIESATRDGTEVKEQKTFDFFRGPPSKRGKRGNKRT